MSRKILILTAISIVIISAVVVGLSVLFSTQRTEERFMESSELDQLKKEKLEIIEAQDVYENDIYGYKINIPVIFEYKLLHSGETVKEENLLEKNKYGHHDLVIGRKRIEKEDVKKEFMHFWGDVFARISLPIKVEDFRQYHAESGDSEGISSESTPYPQANSVDEWIDHYEMGRNWGIHGGEWECSKEVVAGNTVAACKRQDLAPTPYLYDEYAEYFFITEKGNFVLQASIVTDFGPEPISWEDPSSHYIVKLEDEVEWLYEEIKKMIVSFSFVY